MTTTTRKMTGVKAAAAQTKSIRRGDHIQISYDMTADRILADYCLQGDWIKYDDGIICVIDATEQMTMREIREVVEVAIERYNELMADR